MQAVMQTGPLIPRKDEACRDWARNLMRKICVNPHKYGLERADADVVRSVVEPFVEAVNAVQRADGRNPPLIARKDALRASMEGTLRVFMGLIRANRGVTIEDKISLGMNVPKGSRTPIPRPRSAPALSITGAFNLYHVLRYADENTPTALRKPHGVTQLEIAMVVTGPGESLQSDPERAKSIGLYTRQPFQVKHDLKNAGLTATYFGRWVTARGLTGPWSLPKRMTICAGGSADDGQAPKRRETAEYRQAA